MGRTRNNYYNHVGAAAFEIYRRWRQSPMANNVPFKYRVGLNIPYRNGFSRTLTQTKKEEEMNEDNPQGVKTSYIDIHTGNRMIRGALKGALMYRDAFDMQNSWEVGTSLFAIAAMVGTRSQYTTITSNAITGDRTEVAYANFFSLNPLQGVPAGVIINANTNPSQDCIGVKSGWLHFDFVNKTNIPVIAKLHFFVATLDVSASPLEAFANALFSENTYNSTYAFGAGNSVPVSSGNQTYTLIAGTSTNSQALKVLPYTNLTSKRTFKSSWRKLRTKTFVLSAADSHRVNCKLTLNQYQFKERLTSINELYPKGCLCAVVEYQSTCTKLVAGEAMVYGGGDVGFTCTRKLNLCPMKAPNARFDNCYVGAGTLGAGGAINTVEFLSETLATATGAAI